MPPRSLPDNYRGPRSPEEAAAWLTAKGFAMSASTVRRLVDSGEIDADITPQGWRRIRQSVLERYVEEHE